MPATQLFRRTTLPDDSPATIIIRPEVYKRLRETAFRGPRLACAGNTRFKSPRECLAHPVVRFTLLRHALNAILAHEDTGASLNRLRVEISLETVTGWSTNIDINDLTSRYSLKIVKPNAHAAGHMVIPERSNILAPTTLTLLIIYRVTFDPSTGWKLTIGTIQPGPDIGPLRGNLSAQGIILLHPENPGVPIFA